jgi:uncharacterized radical SAM protein YgiQ
MENSFLPISQADLAQRNWKELEIILITGDAYVDHPTYGAALLGRLLESAGYKIGIIAQPDWKNKADFLKLGRPKLFFGVTAGNLDSLVANYTANKRPRKKDDYSPGGKTGLRPDRALIVYANKIREAFQDAVIVLGGLEASLRRLSHYDYWSDRVRRSILVDARADILVYGMAERQILEIAQRLKEKKDLENIRGTVIVKKSLANLRDYVTVPSFEESALDKDKFNLAFKTTYLEADPFRGRTLVQAHGNRFIVQYPASHPLNNEELDRIYALPYARKWHPVYDKAGGVPGFATVKFSITAHRGCPGECSFCSLTLHQGRIIQSRSEESILREVKILTQQKDFRGTITDVGGPTANLYQAECQFWQRQGACKNKSCIYPQKCANLELGYRKSLALWKKILQMPKVKHLFIESGMRYDLLVDKYSDEYLKTLCAQHVSGQLKVAPEHTVDSVLALMHKPAAKFYEKFVQRFEECNQRLNKKQFLVNYFITSHPGAGLKEARELASYLRKKHLRPEQTQDFLPLPMTRSSCMYYTGKDPLTGKAVYVAKAFRERKMQRALIQQRAE